MISESILLRNETRDVGRLSALVSTFCENQALPPSIDMALNLVAEEAFMNVVMHGHESEGGHEIKVTLTLHDSAVEMCLEDDAIAFNPLTVPEFDPTTPIDQRGVGGLGVHLLRTQMTELRYERVDGKNRLTMRKTIPMK